jgi:hypothetical protein
VCPDPRGELEDVVGFERVHAGNPDKPRPERAQVMFDGSAEPQIRDRDTMAFRFERGRDVLHAKRLDAKERTEAEFLATRYRPEKEDVHGETPQRNTRLIAAPPLPGPAMINNLLERIDGIASTNIRARCRFSGRSYGTADCTFQRDMPPGTQRSWLICRI